MSRTCVIMAGGLGSRLKPFTEAIPKPLLPIGEKSLLEIQITRLKKYSFDRIFVATHYKSHYVRNFLGDGSQYGVELTVSEEKEPLGNVGPLTLIREQLTEPFITLNGDILSLIDYRDFYEFACGLPANLCVAVKRVITPFDFGTILFDGDYVTEIREKPDLEIDVMAGIYVMKPEIFEMIPEGEYFCMDSLILNMLNQGKKVGKYRLEEYWLDIGMIPDYEKAQSDYEEHFKEE